MDIGAWLNRYVFKRYEWVDPDGVPWTADAYWQIVQIDYTYKGWWPFAQTYVDTYLGIIYNYTDKYVSFRSGRYVNMEALILERRHVLTVNLIDGPEFKNVSVDHICVDTIDGK